MHKKHLEKRLAKLLAKRETLTKRALASEDAAEVRAIQEQLADLPDYKNVTKVTLRDEPFEKTTTRKIKR